MAPDPLAWIEDELNDLDARTLRRQLAVRAASQGPVIEIDGQRLVNFGSNDYLGLSARHLNEAAVAAIRASGWGAGASPLVVGRGQFHHELEQRLADFEGTQAALLFPSGFAANVGAITSLVGKPDVVFSDAKNHASIIDGCRLSGAEIRVYRHRDVEDLHRQLASARNARRRLIVTDSLFSMDGDLAPLAELAEIAASDEAMLMVDEAHATGVFGPCGRGVAEHLGVEAGVHIRIGTLSKGLGSVGGFVAGSQRLIDWLTNRARSFVFSTALPEATAAASLEALRIVRNEPWRGAELLARADELRTSLVAQGWCVGRSASQIVPVILGDAAATMSAAATLRARGLFVPGIRPPSVPEGESLLRISLSYAHTSEMVAQLVEELRAIKNQA